MSSTKIPREKKRWRISHRDEDRKEKKKYRARLTEAARTMRGLGIPVPSEAKARVQAIRAFQKLLGNDASSRIAEMARSNIVNKPWPTKSIDAAEPLDFVVLECHVKHSKEHKPEECMIARALMDTNKNIERVAVHRNVVWIQYRGDDFKTRYQASTVLRDAMIIFDRKLLKKSLSREMLSMPRDGWRTTLYPPRKAYSLEHLRDPKVVAARRSSDRRRRIEIANGSRKNDYRKPDSLTLEGVRISRGYR